MEKQQAEKLLAQQMKEKEERELFLVNQFSSQKEELQALDK